VLALAIAVRLPGLFTDFWLDEIWALLPIPAIQSVTDIFTSIHHTVNHYLITLWMFVTGLGRDVWIYRLPSLVAGAAAVGAAGALARAEGSNPAFTMLLTSLSAPLVIYSSEARGYAIAATSSLTALLCLIRWIEQRRFGWLAGYWLAMCAGLLGHLSFVFVLGPTTVVLLVLMVRDKITPVRALAVQGVPVALFGWLFVVDVRFLQSGGGEPRGFLDLVAQAGSLGIAGVPRGRMAWLLGAVCGLVLVLEIARRFRQWHRGRRRETDLAAAAFYPAAFLLPLAVVLLTRQTHFYPRYLLVVLVFVPVLVASWARSLPGRRGWLVAAAFIAVNAASLAQFTIRGRGSYDEALALMQRTSQRDVVTIASDHPLTGMVVDFYAPRLGGASRFQFVTGGGAEFWIATSPAAACTPCELIGAFPASMVAGTDWFVYRRQ
jgi:hypothetical protein